MAARGTRSLAGAKTMRARRKNAARPLSYILQNPGNMELLNLDRTPRAVHNKPSMDFLKKQFQRTLTPGLLALVLAAGAAGTAAGWKLWLEPMRPIAERRYQTHQALMRLYDMQLAYHGARGTYADDLESLLASAPDGARVGGILRANADYATLTVVGDARRFRLEANVLDPGRTVIKIRGPMGAPVRP